MSLYSINENHWISLIYFYVLSVTHEPEIHTCRMGCESLLGEAANTTSGNGSAACYDTQDGHVNFPIDHIFFEFSFLFELPAPVPENIPGYNDYAVSELFGIIAADVTTLKYLANGEIIFLRNVSQVYVLVIC